MTNSSRVPAGVPTGGQFAASAHAEADGVSLPVPGAVSEIPYIDLPGGILAYRTEQSPDPGMTPMVKDLGDGTALVTYITHETFTSSGDPVMDALHTLREQRGADRVFTGDEYSAHALDDYLQSSGDNLLDRVAFLRRDGNGSYSAHGRPAAMEDWDEFKNYAHGFDAAVVFPRDRVSEYGVDHVDPIDGFPVRDYSQVARDVEEAKSGRLYTVHHELVQIITGHMLAADADDYDSQIFEADDAIARAESQHEDHEQTVEFMDYDPDDEWDDDDDDDGI